MLFGVDSFQFDGARLLLCTGGFSLRQQGSLIGFIARKLCFALAMLERFADLRLFHHLQQLFERLGFFRLRERNGGTE